MNENSEKKRQAFTVGALFYILALFAGLHFLAVRTALTVEGDRNSNILDLIMEALNHMTTNPFSLKGAFDNPAYAFKVLGIVTVIFLLVALYVWSENQSKEHENSKTAKGSAEFNTDFKGFKQKYTKKKATASTEEPDPNIILGKDIYYGLERGRNTNVMIIGSAGSGKSFGVIKPNIMQMNTSLVCTDPSGEMFMAEAKLLLEHGYKVKIFSTSDMLHSNCYNPFDYVYGEDGAIEETRVSTMVNMFLQNATDLQNNRGDKFWDQASKAILNACAMLLLEFYPRERQNMYEMLRLIQKGKVSEKDSDNQTELDKIFSRCRKHNPDAHCFSSYDTFKLAPARTANSILISAGVDLNMFNQTKVRNMTTTSYAVKSRNTDGRIRQFHHDRNGELIWTDENIDLRTIGDEKTCLFINIPQADSTYNFLVSMMYSQLFECLYGRAEKICPNKWMVVNSYGQSILSMIDSKEDAQKLISFYREAEIIEKEENSKQVFYIYNREAEKRLCLPGFGRGRLKKVYSRESGQMFLDQFKNCRIVHGAKVLPVHVQCLLDEFSNIGAIPEFPQKLATMRKYEISCMIVLQSLSQLKNRYDKLWADVLSNCDCTIFLGTTDPETCKYISQDRLGKRTIRILNRSKGSSGRGKNSSASYNLDARDLMTPDEVSRLDKNTALIMVSGEKPFKVKKYKASDHPNWKLTGDVDPDEMMEPSELVVCREKRLCSYKDASSIILQAVQAAVNRNAEGRQAVSEVEKVHNADEAARAAGVKKKENIKYAVSEWERFDADGEDDPLSEGYTGQKQGAASIIQRRKK